MKGITFIVLALLPSMMACRVVYDPPQEYIQETLKRSWVTTARVNVRCPDGTIVATVDQSTAIQIVGRGNEGWVKINFDGETPCTGHYMKAQYLRPLKLTFWNLNPGWQNGIDIDGVHYQGGSAFQLLAADSEANTLTIIGPRGIPTTIQSIVGVANDDFIRLHWDSASNAVYCADLDSSKFRVMYFKVLGSFVATVPGALAVVILLIAVHALSAVGRGGFSWPWLFGIMLSLLFVGISAISYYEYEDGKHKCEAVRSFVSRQVTPDGFVLPIEDARYIQAESLKFGEQFTDIDQVHYRNDFESSSGFFLLIQPFYLLIGIRASMGLYYFLAPHPMQKPNSPRGMLPMASDKEITVPHILSKGDEVILRPESTAPVVGVPFRMIGMLAMRDAALANLNTQTIRAIENNIEARIDLSRVMAKEENRALLIEADREWLKSLLNKAKVESKRTAIELQNLEDRETIAQLETDIRRMRLQIELAELTEKLNRLRNPPPPMSEDMEMREAIRQKIRERLREHYTVATLRKEEEVLRNEILYQANGVVTRDVQRVLDNLRDAVQSLIDEL